MGSKRVAGSLMFVAVGLGLFLAPVAGASKAASPVASYKFHASSKAPVETETCSLTVYAGGTFSLTGCTPVLKGKWAETGTSFTMSATAKGATFGYKATQIGQNLGSPSDPGTATKSGKTNPVTWYAIRT